MASYKNRISKYFNRKARSQRFRIEDLMLRRAEAVDHALGNLRSIWEEPFEVIRQLSGGAYNREILHEDNFQGHGMLMT